MLGFSSKDDSMTVNELNWWHAYSLICYLEPEREAFFNTRIIKTWSESSWSECFPDFFAKKYDKDWQKAEDDKIRKELEELEAKKKNVTKNRRNNT